jgi:hypothetical protein
MRPYPYERPSARKLNQPSTEMRSLLMALGAAAAVIALWTVARRRRRTDDLGSVSSRWIDEHVRRE